MRGAPTKLSRGTFVVLFRRAIKEGAQSYRISKGFECFCYAH